MAKRLKSIGLYERWMFVCVALATVLRLVLIYFNWPFTDSDEGNMGVLALHVAFRGEHPVFFYGGNYLGPLEGYLAAPLFRLFGSSLFTLRLPLVLFFAVFLLGMYYLICLLYQKPAFALAMVALLGLGSPDVLFLQLRASGEYPELEMFAALMCLLGIWLALTLPKPGQTLLGKQLWKRAAIYCLLGLLVGLALWVDLLAGPFVLGIGLLLWFFNRQELKSRLGLSLLLGLIVGAFPLIYYNLTAPWTENSLFVLFGLNHSGAAQMLASHLTWVNQFTGTFFIALPMATSGAWNCPLSTIPPSGSPTLATLPCVLAQSVWGLGYLALGLLAGALAIYAIRQAYRRWRAGLAVGESPAWEERQAAIRWCGQLVVLVGVGLTLLLYAISPSPAAYPDTSFRYLTCLFLALPVLLWPLWQGLSTRKFSAKWVLWAAVLLFVVVTLISGTVKTLLQMPTTQARYEQQQALVQDLLHVNATRLYTDYWTCNILIYLSQEKIICSALDTSMNPAQDRYWPYHLIVRATPHPGYIFAVGSPEAKIMQQRALAAPSHYREYTFEGYVVYQEI